MLKYTRNPTAAVNLCNDIKDFFPKERVRLRVGDRTLSLAL